MEARLEQTSILFIHGVVLTIKMSKMSLMFVVTYNVQLSPFQKLQKKNLMSDKIIYHW